ncbi:MAG: sugar-binding protein, partial [Kiritimatiellae bacterium]|nr:sugar-binding protein [Kiritimatiellia bacterium]
AKHLADTRDDLPLLRVQRLEDKVRSSWTEAARISYDRMLALQKAALGPALTCPRLDDTVVLDGSLTEGAWSQALRGEMTNIADKGPPPACATRLSVWRDAEYLYFGVLCAETNMQALTAETTTQTPSPAIWKNDSIEIFLDTANRCEAYFQIGIDVAGQTVVYHWLAPSQMDSSFGAREIEAAVRKQEGQWIVEARIPFAVLGGAPLPESRWGVNMVRNRPPKGGEPEQHYGWFGNAEGKYHVPGSFGRMIFKR